MQNDGRKNACSYGARAYLGGVPNYDYRCETCGHEFEVFQSMNDAKLTDCPQGDCAGQVKRLLGTGAGIIFKGGGFYETDYRSDSYKKGAKSESESKEPKAEKKDAGGEKSKPAEKKKAE